MTYEIGKFYEVPCVRGRWEDRVADWPVMGALHEDGAIIGFPHPHYHIDWRFVSERVVGPDHLTSFFYGMTRIQHCYAKPLTIGPRINQEGLPPPIMRRRKFQRDHSLPFDVKKISWLPKLEAAHETCKLSGLVCPHRGYDLTHEPIAEDGTITCPMHGLRWNAFTGEPVRRDENGKGAS